MYLNCYVRQIWHLVMVVCSLVPDIHGRRKECLVSAVCACVKLTSFVAPLFCIMMQSYLINTSSRSIAEKKVNHSPHGHFSMASSHCIIHLCRLYVRPRLMRTRCHCHCKWPLRGRKNTIITQLCIIHMRKNTKITWFPRFLGKFHACANGWNQAFFPPSVNVGYEARSFGTLYTTVIELCDHIEPLSKNQRADSFLQVRDLCVTCV